MENHHRSSTSHDIWSDGTPSAPMSTIFSRGCHGCHNIVISLSLWLSWSQAASAAQPNYIFPSGTLTGQAGLVEKCAVPRLLKARLSKGHALQDMGGSHALTPNQALASQTRNCLKLMGNQWMLDKLVISCSFWTTDNSNGSPTSFPQTPDPRFPLRMGNVGGLFPQVLSGTPSHHSGPSRNVLSFLSFDIRAIF